MASLYLRSYDVERNFHPPFVDKGYRRAVDFKMDFVGTAYATIVLTLLWNEDKKLVSDTTRTETTVTDAAVVLSKEGIGWATVADIPGYDPWVSYKKYDNSVSQTVHRGTASFPSSLRRACGRGPSREARSDENSAHRSGRLL